MICLIFSNLVSQQNLSFLSIDELERNVAATIDSFVDRGMANVSLNVQRDSLPSALWMDEARVKQVVLNFVSNAIKYGHAGGPIHVTVQGMCTPPTSEWTAGRIPASTCLVFEVAKFPVFIVRFADDA